MPTSGRDPATGEELRSLEEFAGALSLMERALDIIDHHDGPVDVGAHLDLAIDRLKRWIELSGR
jgi:hypothetical protein